MKTGPIGRVQSPRIIRLGGGVADETAEVLLQLGLSSPLIVTDPMVARLHLDRLTAVLDQAKLIWGIFDQVVEDLQNTFLIPGLMGPDEEANNAYRDLADFVTVTHAYKSESTERMDQLV